MDFDELLAGLSVDHAQILEKSRPRPVTLVWRTDIHLSDYAPQSRLDNWTDTILEKIRQVGQIACEVQADAVIDGGDFFSIKSPTKNSHSLVRQAIEAHRGYPCPVYATVGNHDCIYGNYSYLDQQPLGVLFASGVFKRLYDQHEARFLGSDGTTVRVVGIPYHGAKYDMSRFTDLKRDGEDYLMVAAHLLASRVGGSLFESEDVLKYADLEAVPADVFSFGHWHKNQGIYEIPNSDNIDTFGLGRKIINIGSLSRGSISEDDTTRIPSVAILRFYPEGVVVEERRLVVSPAEKVFDLAGKNYDELKKVATDEFMDKLNTSLTRDNQRPLQDIIRDMILPENVRERLLVYLEKARPNP